MPYRLGKAILYGVLLWIIGFVWGSIVFMTALKNVASIPYVSSNPAISFPILIVWPVVIYFLSKNYLKAAPGDKAAEGLKLGVTLAVVNFVLDLVVLIMLLKAPATYFVSLTVWLGDLMLIMIPWLVGRSMQGNAA